MAQSLEGLIAFLGVLFFIFVIGLLLVYIYTAICLYFIAKKTQTENPWLAFIPIANIFLMAMIARQHWGWALGLLLVNIIPFVGSLVSFGIMIYLLWKISEQRNVNGALSLLMIIPVVNLIYIGYLAFKD